MHFIDIPKVVTRETTFSDKKTGLPVFEQVVLICHPDKLGSIEGTVLLKNDKEGKPQSHAVGRYQLGADCIEGGKYGRVEFRLIVGEPIKAQPQKVAA